jgi:FlaA1/EpsC-like NDP-sugar epimerase
MADGRRRRLPLRVGLREPMAGATRNGLVLVTGGAGFIGQHLVNALSSRPTREGAR